MSTISATAVKALRDRTNLPMMDCKSALTEANGDMDKAIDILRTRGKGVVVKREGRETAEGRVAIYIDSSQTTGAIVEMRCESPPVVGSEAFVQLANDVAKQVALKGAGSVEALLKQPYVEDSTKTVSDHVGDVIALIRENMRPARIARLTGGLLGGYCHHNGSVGALLQVEGAKADPQLLKEICMHITFKNPLGARRADVPASVVEKEREIARAQAEATGKPANLVAKIAEGKLNTFYAENVLEEQPFVKDESKKIGELLKSAGLKLVTFVRYKVGEGS